MTRLPSFFSVETLSSTMRRFSSREHCSALSTCRSQDLPNMQTHSVSASSNDWIPLSSQAQTPVLQVEPNPTSFDRERSTDRAASKKALSFGLDPG